MYTITIESYREFADRHGNRPLNVAGQLLFADGASCLDDGEGRQEPPRDPVENLRLRLRYWKAAIKRSESDFAAVKGECSRQAELAARYANLPGPSNAAIADLHKLRDAVAYCRTEAAKLQTQLVEKTINDPDRLRRRTREEYERQQQTAAATVLAEIASINI
jgi:hypothetical protein